MTAHKRAVRRSILTLTAGSGYTVGTDRVHTLTIADNEAAPVGTPVASFAVASFTTNEGSGTYNVVVNLSPAPTANTTISYTVDVASSTAATPGTDYTRLTGTVVASASASSVEIPVVITEDSVGETSETGHTDPDPQVRVYTVGTDRVHTLTIADKRRGPGRYGGDARDAGGAGSLAAALRSDGGRTSAGRPGLPLFGGRSTWAVGQCERPVLWSSAAWGR